MVDIHLMLITTDFYTPLHIYTDTLIRMNFMNHYTMHEFDFEFSFLIADIHASYQTTL